MRIGIVRYWVDRPAAEHEVIERLKRSAAARAHEIVELNPDGSLLGEPQEVPAVDLVLNLHYSSPKVRDLPHVGVLWNPLRFYHDFGFNPHFANQLSFDLLATCGSSVVEDAIRPFRPDLFGSGPLPELHHSVPERYLEPRLRTNRQLFYVGVNWERVAGITGRHDDLLYLLDEAGISRIYGPRKIEGIAPWGGYQTYQGDLPFDGWSVVEAIDRAGTALVVSSPAHYRDGIMSSRPFEAAAAGVPIISEHHPFMLEHFSGAVLFFDERATATHQAEEIAALVRRLNDDPEEALELARRSQEILRTRFNMAEQLDRLCTSVSARTVARTARVAVTAVVVPLGSPDEFSRWATGNGAVLARFSDVVVVPSVRDEAWETAVAASGLEAAHVVVSTRGDTGWSERAGRAVETVDGPVCFLLGMETLFADFPDAVQAVSSGGGSGVVAAVAVPVVSHLDVNDRLPRLLAGRVANWGGLPVAGIVSSGERVRELQRTLGPGAHMGVVAAEAWENDAAEPEFVPRFSVNDDRPEPWALGYLVGDEWHRDRQYALALPRSIAAQLPEALLAPEHPLEATPRKPLRGRLAYAARHSPIPSSVTEPAIAAAKSALRPRGSASKPGAGLAAGENTHRMTRVALKLPTPVAERVAKRLNARRS